MIRREDGGCAWELNINLPNTANIQVGAAAGCDLLILI